MAFLSSETNSFRDQDVRRALAPLALLAERLAVAVVIVRHLNKNSEGNPIYRGGGSIGIIGAARSGLLVAPDPDDPEKKRRILALTKTNLGPGCASLCYTIEPADEGSIRVCWSGESLHHAASLLASSIAGEERTELEEAQEFLKDVLVEGPLAAKAVIDKGKAQGFTERTVKRAKEKLSIRSKKVGSGAGSTWEWELPKKANDKSKGANSSSLASFAQPSDSTPIKSDIYPKDAKSDGMVSFEEKAWHPLPPTATETARNGQHRVKVVSWQPRRSPLEVAGVGEVTNTELFATRTLEQLRSLIENPKKQVAWTVPQLVGQLSAVGVIVEVSE